MTIAFVSTIRSPWGGSEELWAAAAKEALPTHNVIISAFECGELSIKTVKLVEKGAKVDLRVGTIQQNLTPLVRLRKKIKRVYLKFLGNPFNNLFHHKPGVVLYIGTAYSIGNSYDYKLLSGLQKYKARFFINVQLNSEDIADTLTTRQKARTIEAYKTALSVFFVSGRNSDVAKKVLGVAIPNALVVRNPVNMESLEAIPPPQNSTVHFAMVGNLSVIHKGQDIALEVLGSEAWKQRDWHLNIYGTGDDEPHLKNLVDFWGLQQRVTFHGRVANIRQLWQTNHVLLMPSHMEGMPLAVVEAMICARPAVVTDVGGNTEWISEGIEGFMAEAPTVFSFGNAMERAWAAKPDWGTIGQNAHKKALELYDPQPGKTLLRLLTGE